MWEASKKEFGNLLQEPLIVVLLLHVKANESCKGHKRAFLFLKLASIIAENPELFSSWSLEFVHYHESFCSSGCLVFLSWPFCNDISSSMKLRKCPFWVVQTILRSDLVYKDLLAESLN